MSLPDTLANGFLPPGGHVARLDDRIGRFGAVTPRRVVLADRLPAWLRLAQASQQWRRAVLFGRFVPDASFPRDLEVFRLMHAGCDQAFQLLLPPQRDVFD